MSRRIEEWNFVGSHPSKREKRRQNLIIKCKWNDNVTLCMDEEKFYTCILRSSFSYLLHKITQKVRMGPIDWNFRQNRNNFVAKAACHVFVSDIQMMRQHTTFILTILILCVNIRRNTLWLDTFFSGHSKELETKKKKWQFSLFTGVYRTVILNFFIILESYTMANEY